VTEAGFVAIALGLGYFPDGITRYHRIYALPAESRMRRSVFILWREAAFAVGSLPSRPEHTPEGMDRYDVINDVQFFERLALFKMFAAHVRSAARKDPGRLARAASLSDWAWRTAAEWGFEDFQYLKYYGGSASSRALMQVLRYQGPQRTALALRGCEILAEIMENEPQGDLVGSALTYYMEQGILLADVHHQNIGKTKRTDAWVITDPGHAVLLDNRYTGVGIEAL